MPGKRLKIDLDEIAFAMSDSSRDINDHYLDIETGELYAVDTHLVRQIEEGEQLKDVPEWMEELVPVARAVVAGDRRYRRIPEVYSDEAYRVIEDFIYGEVEDEAARSRLDEASHGRGAFRRFKDALEEFPELRERWLEYETERHREWVREWLEEIGIEAEEQEP
jgi:hypothetical protein